MGMRAVGFSRDDLRSDIAIAEGGVVTFLEAAEGSGPIVFV